MLPDGAMVDPENITFYFDGVELWKVKTPEEAEVPLYVLVNLALGGGWPIDKTPSLDSHVSSFS